MSETVRGRALIINNNTFSESSKLHRKGSLRDVSNIRGVLALLDFEVDVRHDRTAKVTKYLYYFISCNSQIYE